MLVPSDKLVTKPDEGALSRAPSAPGAVEEDGVLSASRLADGLAVDLGPLLRVAVVVAPRVGAGGGYRGGGGARRGAVVVAARVGAGVEYRVVGEALSEVRHPSGSAAAE